MFVCSAFLTGSNVAGVLSVTITRGRENDRSLYQDRPHCYCRISGGDRSGGPAVFKNGIRPNGPNPCCCRSVQFECVSVCFSIRTNASTGKDPSVKAASKDIIKQVFAGVVTVEIRRGRAPRERVRGALRRPSGLVQEPARACGALLLQPEV